MQIRINGTVKIVSANAVKYVEVIGYSLFYHTPEGVVEVVGSLRKAYSYAETKYYAAVLQGFSKNSLIEDPKELFAWWIPLLIAIDVLSAAMIGFWMFLAIRSVKLKNHNKKS